MDKIKLVAMDLDNTLLNGEKKISLHTKEVLKEAIQKGVLIVPATGRIFKAIPEFIRELSGVRYAICCNGATIYDKREDKIIYTNHLSAQTVYKVLDLLDGYHCSQDIYRDGQGYMESRFYHHLEDYKIEGPMYEMIKTTRVEVENLREDIKEEDKGIEKMCAFFDDLEKKKEVWQKLNQVKEIAVTSAIWNNIEINSATCNKGDGLSHLASYLNIPMSQVMACGDASNDEKMIEAAGFGVVMENGIDVLKEKADFVTKSNEEDGVAYAIEKFVL